MPNVYADLLGEVAEYYTEKLAQHGETPQGVDWNGEESQHVRFAQLCKVIDPAREPFSVCDLGSGYGAFYAYVRAQHPAVSFLGVDVSDAMTQAAQARYAGDAQARFITAGAPDVVCDYVVASGIFNVRQERSNEEWRGYIEEMIAVLDRSSSKGFAFNCLTSYSDTEKMRDYLYYADPCYFFDVCKRRYSRQVALLHDYGLYEFTLVVRKDV